MSHHLKASENREMLSKARVSKSVPWPQLLPVGRKMAQKCQEIFFLSFCILIKFGNFFKHILNFKNMPEFILQVYDFSMFSMLSWVGSWVCNNLLQSYFFGLPYFRPLSVSPNHFYVFENTDCGRSDFNPFTCLVWQIFPQHMVI